MRYSMNLAGENVFEFKRWFQLVRTEKVDEAIGKNAAIGARLNANKENYLSDTCKTMRTQRFGKTTLAIK